ncbi:hypothetical protein [Pseudonocardia humida]|uniref:Uncharacterized protein n=1 Tax=Pseudonocardia humida TaxID=2800819 RepID=A0ABT1A5A6_9PSEU|nr:hypothetical protein [Pseudonocardia humida]MCO1658178.1 hypothetical protein [Pseudonocardia humida]
MSVRARRRSAAPTASASAPTLRGQLGERLGAALVHGDGEVLVDQPAGRLGGFGDAGLLVGVEPGLAGGLGHDLVGLRLGGGQDLRGLALGLAPAVLDLGLGPGQHAGDLVLGHPHHRPHALAHALDALRGAQQRTDLRSQPFGPGACLVQLMGELRRLIHRGVAVVHQDAHLGLDPAQVPLDLRLVVALPDHGEPGRRRSGVWWHAGHRTPEA